MDPVHILPPEVSSEIIACASLANRLLNQARMVFCVDLLLEFTLVSRTWRKLILTTPELWADIVIDTLTDDTAAKIVLQCELSRDYPLLIAISPWSTNKTELLLPLLGDNARHRIRELHAALDKQSAPLKRLLGPLPSLEVLRNNTVGWTPVADETTVSFINTQSCLKVIGGIALDKKLLELSWLPLLQEVSFDGSLHTLMPHLDALSNVRRMRFDIIQPEHSIPFDLYRVHTLSRLYWTQLSVDERGDHDSFHFWQNIDVLASALAQSLTVLSCHLDFGLLSHLVPHLAGFARLELLKILLRQYGELELNSGPIKASTVKTVSIRTYHRYEYAIDGRFTSLLSMMIQCFRNTTSICLDGWSKEQMKPLLRQGGLPNLREVTLSTIHDYSSPGFTLSPTIRLLKIGGFCRDMESYRSRGVRELSYNFSNDSETFQYAILHPNFWPSMTRLSTSGRQHIDWMESSLKNLTVIVLTAGGYMSIPYQGTRLLNVLALYPHKFPSVARLELTPLIEWDILFCFLETRNTHSNASYVRIQTIVFHGKIPLEFPGLISQLLLGHTVNRPSNLELSWVGNLEILQDFHLPGCLECLKSLRYSCQEGVMSRLGSKSWELPAFKPYPTGNNSVLMTWPARDGEWSQYATSQHTRRAFCRRKVSGMTTKMTTNSY